MDFDDNRAGTGTREWSEAQFSVGRGCSHRCAYCYAASTALRFKLIENPAEWGIEQLKKKPFSGMNKVYPGVCMYPVSHDINGFYLEPSLEALRRLLSKGNKVLLVTKPALVSIARICAEFSQYKDNIMFRFTIGSLEPAHTTLWEPGAPVPAERLAALRHAFVDGFRTSVSMEPFLGPVDDAIDTFFRLEPFVTDTIWVGLINKIGARVKDRTPEVLAAIANIKAWQSDAEILRLHTALKDNPKVQWKDSIKKVLEYYGRTG